MRRSAPRLLAPEVVQSSVMDCGPAALKCLLEGFGVPVDYGRLREACQTDVDGTSIDALETAVVALGLDAEQVMLPLDHVFIAETKTWPALVVVRQPNGEAHFVIVWRRHGRWLQVMDPGVGRRWVTRRQFLNELYLHVVAVDAEAYCAWMTSAEALTVLHSQLGRLGLTDSEVEQQLEAAVQTRAWRALAQLDAATRMVTALIEARALRRGTEAARAWRTLRAGPAQAIPQAYWTVRPNQDSAADASAELWLTGAVLLRIHGRGADPAPATLSAELGAAVGQATTRPYRAVAAALAGEDRAAALVLGLAIGLLAAGLALEALLLRALLNLDDALALTDQRLSWLAAVALFAGALLALEFLIADAAWRLGRRLELRLRMAFLHKIPRLHDSYFQSRLSSDMAERSHSAHLLRLLPVLVSQSLRALALVILTVAGIIWLDPAGAPPALLLLVGVIVLPLAAQPALSERELRLRTHAGGLARFYLDALVGLMAVRAHGAEQTIARQYESHIAQWGRAGLALGRAAAWAEGLTWLGGLSLAAYLLHGHIGRAGGLSSALLLAYWALQLPPIGQELVLLARQLAAQRNVILRLIEPLGAPEEPPGSPDAVAPAVTAAATAIALVDVSVQVAGHAVLAECALKIAPGEHIAIVGPSGAGKSTLLGLLLGWHRPARGEVRVDGEPLTTAALARLRASTAWVDPAAQLWNRSLLDNVRYGLAADAEIDLPALMAKSALQDALARLPEGLQTLLGEGGAMVSGGEGQRLRLARALARRDVRLALLDEPFRGLDRAHRRDLLAVVRDHWREATLLCVTHDVADTQDFPRVLVIERGRIIEDDAPSALLARADSRYGALLAADEETRQGAWRRDSWRRLRLIDGQLRAQGRRADRNVVSIEVGRHG